MVGISVRASPPGCAAYPDEVLGVHLMAVGTLADLDGSDLSEVEQHYLQEVARWTVPRAWAERTHNVARYTKLPRAGHFAPVEVPDLLADDIVEFAGMISRLDRSGEQAFLRLSRRRAAPT